MNILGYDGPSFELVTELFAHGMREGVLQHGRGVHLNPQASVFVPTSTSGSAGIDGVTSPRTHEEGLTFIEAQLEANASRPLFSNTAPIQEAIQYPNVYTSTSATAMNSYGGRLALPMGTIRKEKDVR
jgi:hypothetical protein